MSGQTKKCCRCGHIRAVTAFTRDVSRKDGRAPDCRSCRSASSAAYRAANPHKVKASYIADRDSGTRRARNKRNAHRISKQRRCAKYGITEAEYDSLHARQRGKCANPACRVDFGSIPRKQIHTDHCHSTGYVRGLLCHHCNLALGNTKDDPAKLRGLAEYLDAAEAMRKIFEK